MDYVNATPEEKEAWIQAYIKRRLEAGFNTRGKRWNTKTAGAALKGTMSVKSTLRHRAKVDWNKRKKRQAAK